MSPNDSTPGQTPPPRVEGAQALAELGMSLAILLRVIATKLLTGEWQPTRPPPMPPMPMPPGTHPPQGQVAPPPPAAPPAQPPAQPPPQNPKSADWLGPQEVSARHQQTS